MSRASDPARAPSRRFLNRCLRARARRGRRRRSRAPTARRRGLARGRSPRAVGGAPADRSRRAPRARRRAARCWRCAIASTSEAGRRPARRARASAARSTAPRFEWRSSLPSASLVIFAGPPAMVTRGTGCARRYFEQAADEIAHVDQRMIGQAIERADGGLGRFPGRGADMGATARARDVDAAHDRVNPGRARIGYDDAGRAEDRQAADECRDARSAVRSAILSPPGIEISTMASTPAPCRSAASARLARIIARGAGLIAGSPGGAAVRAASPCRRPAGLEAQPGARAREAYGRDDQRAG